MLVCFFTKSVCSIYKCGCNKTSWLFFTILFLVVDGVIHLQEPSEAPTESRVDVSNQNSTHLVKCIPIVMLLACLQHGGDDCSDDDFVADCGHHDEDTVTAVTEEASARPTEVST